MTPILISSCLEARGPAVQGQSIEDEVLGNIRAQPIGSATIGDLNLPEPFLRRFADRIIRASFEDNFRVVIADEPEPASSATAPPGASTSSPEQVTTSEGATPDAQAGSRGPQLVLLSLGVLLVLGLLFILSRRRRA